MATTNMIYASLSNNYIHIAVKISHTKMPIAFHHHINRYKRPNENQNRISLESTSINKVASG